MAKIIHPLNPIFNSESKILILGSLPSIKSRELKFYYSHPQNRFWKTISSLFNEDMPINNIDKEKLLINHNLDIW